MFYKALSRSQWKVLSFSKPSDLLTTVSSHAIMRAAGLGGKQTEEWGTVYVYDYHSRR